MDSAVAAQHRDQGFTVVERLTPRVTLDDVFSEAGFGEVHWLKIDVEGCEASVIHGWQGGARPWLVVVESTSPLSQVETHSAWEPALLGKGYVFAYFDGLNRYYVSSEHAELLRSFGPGPNVFDDFALSGSASQPFTRLLKAEMTRVSSEYASFRRMAEEDAAKARQALALANDQAVQLGRELRQHRESAQYWQAASEQMREELRTIKASRSWRLTAPIRQLRAGDLSVGALARRIVRGLLARLMARVVRRPTMARWMRKLLRLTPGLKARLRNIGVAYGFVDEEANTTGLDGHAAAPHPALSLKASRILKDIDLALDGKEA
jgi:hypothetical protein